MYLKNLHLVNFKNWEQASFDFAPKLNCFVGSNGSGKTNLLDAIHYLSVCKSYFNTIDSQNIKDDEGFFVVEGDFEKDDSESHIYCGLKRGEKKVFKKNKKSYDKLADHIGRYPSVIISPYDRDLITEGSEIRRKFMDNVISQSDPIYLDNLVRYNKAVQQRNALLKFFAANHTFDKAGLEVYDEQMQERGVPVYEKRKEFLEQLEPKLSYYYNIIADGREAPAITYQSQLHENSFNELLEKYRDKDRINQYSGAGIHKDDLQFSIDGRKVKKFGSQGQQKSFLIALKLAQYDFLYTKQGVKPLLLLDDIFDKLDEVRVEQLVRLVHDENFGQIFITDTHANRTAHLVKNVDDKANVFTIQNAKIEHEEKQ